MNQDTDQPSPDWQKTNYSNLVRYVPSGKYFARVRVKGKLIRRSLKTDVLSVAKLRLDDLQKKERTLAEAEDRIQNGRMKFSEAATLVEQSIAANASLKPRTKAYYKERLVQLYKTWPGLAERLVRSVSARECEAWATKFRSNNSPTNYNHTASLLRRVFEKGIEFGASYVNPAEKLSHAKEKSKELQLPEPRHFTGLIAHIERARNGYDAPSANLVKFLAFGGFRITEAKNVTWQDVDFERERITVRGAPETGTKNSEIRFVPMIPEMRTLLERLRSERADEAPSNSLMTVGDCRKALASGCKKLGIPEITHHDLRHLFATRCIESGVDIPTVSRWLGHKDGGALAMKTYGHLRDEHSVNMAKKVTFALPSKEANSASPP